MTTKAQLYLNELTAEREFAERLAAKDAEIAQLLAERQREGDAARTMGAVWRIKLAAKDAEIARLREALTEARGWVQDDVYADHRHRGQDVLARIDATLNGSPSPDPAEAVRAEEPVLPEMTLRAWLVGQILPHLLSQGTRVMDDEVDMTFCPSVADVVAMAIQYADEAIRQLEAPK